MTVGAVEEVTVSVSMPVAGSKMTRDSVTVPRTDVARPPRPCGKALCRFGNLALAHNILIKVLFVKDITFINNPSLLPYHISPLKKTRIIIRTT